MDPVNIAAGAGTAIAADPSLDPDGIFSATAGLNVAGSAKDYAPAIPFKQVLVYGTSGGQSSVTLKVTYANGSVFTYNFTVAAYGYWQLPIPMAMTKINTSGTTATNVFPIF
jgi:hypothetical protein